MARIKLQLPHQFVFQTKMAVRISDINYGNHMSNDAYLAFMHEARQQFFISMGYSEMNLAGTSVIMGDTVLVYKKECFYGDIIQIEVTAGEFGQRSFDLFYRFTHASSGQLVCEAKTGMVCFDYANRTTTKVPDEFRNRFV
jgi:YbgC/YbaW family acyl-CoA thioester hydrolase